MEQALIDKSNLTTLSLDDEFVDAFVVRIVPFDEHKFKWYINVGAEHKNRLSAVHGLIVCFF